MALPDTAAYTQWVDALRTVLPDPPAHVLDVDTGTGFVARIAAELGHDVAAIDLSTAMIEASAARNSACPITFTVGGAVDPHLRGGASTPSSGAACCGRCANRRRPSATGTSSCGRVAASSSSTVWPRSPQDPPAPDTDATNEDMHFFERYCTPETQAALPAIHLSDHEVIVRAATAAGFRDVRTTALEMVRGWETSPGSNLPYALIGFRPFEHGGPPNEG